MQVVADLHVHSKYSRAVSQQMTLQTMAQVAVEKGIHLLTASDWTHPAWFAEISSTLEEAGEGVYKLKTGIGTEAMQEVRFLLSTEISSIYKQGDKLRRIHNLVFASSLAKAEAFTKALVNRGANIRSDGRPIVGLSSRELLELQLEVDEEGIFLPCHVWTPHFGLYGSASGFDSIEESFGDLSSYIYAVETGLSSDPEMNWQIPELQERSIVSFSDAHSPAKMGREATVLELSEVSFPAFKQALKREGNTDAISYTIEFYPEEGKYHYSGHRGCKVSLSPEEIRKRGTACPVCRKKVTEGVFIRLSQLSGKEVLESAQRKQNEYGLTWFTDLSEQHPPYVKLVPLLEIVAEALSSTVVSKKVKAMYSSLIQSCGSELDILLKTPTDEIAKAAGENVAEGVAKVRSGDIVIRPGFDGEYGIVKIWGDEGKSFKHGSRDQLSLEF